MRFFVIHGLGLVAPPPEHTQQVTSAQQPAKLVIIGEEVYPGDRRESTCGEKVPTAREQPGTCLGMYIGNIGAGGRIYRSQTAYKQAPDAPVPQDTLIVSSCFSVCVYTGDRRYFTEAWGILYICMMH